ncbi:MAG: phosphoenolpyruvate carboxylase, partial [Solirubrobacteraceae bacterium]|nr:phosphoenolpyruvate carboxylase [Solirubrobacteraceae bacterium]
MPPTPESAPGSLERQTELLESLLGEVLEEQEGRAFRDRVFWIRDMAARVRAGDLEAAEPVVAFVRSQSTSALEPFVRACSMQLQLANVAEELERLRRRREYDSDASVAQPESLASITGSIGRYPASAVAEALHRLDVRLVMTAHPTEAMRRSVFNHQQAVWRAMERLDDPRIGRGQRRELAEELREVLTVWWQTDEVRRVRPRVEDEVRRNLFFFEAVLFDAVPGALGEIEHALNVRLVQPVLSYGSWTGGDMDGHPEVGADTLAVALALHRATALRLLSERVDTMARSFSHSSLRVPLSEELVASLETDERELPSADVLRRAHREWEPLRTKLGFVRHRLTNTARPRGREPGYADAQQLRRDLELVLAHLGSRHVALGSIRRLLWQIDVFGFHLAG